MKVLFVFGVRMDSCYAFYRVLRLYCRNRYSKKMIANLLRKKNPDYIPEDPMEIEHVDEFLKLMAVLTGDNRYVDILKVEGKEIVSMCDVAARLENIGLQKGRAEGIAEGDLKRLIKQICKKMQASLSVEEIADDLAEDDVALIQAIMDAAKEFAPAYDIDAIYEKVAR